MTQTQTQTLVSTPAPAHCEPALTELLLDEVIAETRQKLDNAIKAHRELDHHITREFHHLADENLTILKKQRLAARDKVNAIRRLLEQLKARRRSGQTGVFVTQGKRPCLLLN